MCWKEQNPRPVNVEGHMNKSILLLACAIAHVSALGQGIVNFWNDPTTLISVFTPTGGVTTILAPVGSWYFGLLTAPVGTVDPQAFTFTGVYGTNQSAAGRFTGGSVAIPGWTPGTTRSFMVAGWSADLGAFFQPSWLSTSPYPQGFGLSRIASGSPGGFNPNTGQPDPNLVVFGGFPNNIPVGFIIGVPEPSSCALVGVGIAAILKFHHRRRPVTKGNDQTNEHI
jgi:hypothetical protein